MKITLPLTVDMARKLRAGDSCLLTGTLYTARDAAHKRLTEALDRGEALPIDLTDTVIYYVGPAPAKPGRVIGSAGPTTSASASMVASPTRLSEPKWRSKSFRRVSPTPGMSSSAERTGLVLKSSTRSRFSSLGATMSAGATVPEGAGA